MTNEPMLDEAMKAELARLHGAPERHYHGLAHIEALLGLAADYVALLDDPEAVEAAIWLHDAVYDSRRSDNEAQSAALAAKMLVGRAAPRRIGNVVTMIEATATHALPATRNNAARRDTALFLDMDLSILGAEPDVFDAYEAAIRREYEWVGETEWRTGRAALLDRFAARRSLFHTPEFVRRFEKQARKNLKRSLAALRTAGR